MVCFGSDDVIILSWALGLIRDARFYTIVADETSDSNTEQLVICIRWVSEDFVAHEDFIGLSPL